MIELLKAIEPTFHRRSLFVAKAVGHVTQQFTLNVVSLVETVKVVIASVYVI